MCDYGWLWKRWHAELISHTSVRLQIVYSSVFQLNDFKIRQNDLANNKPQSLCMYTGDESQNQTIDLSYSIMPKTSEQAKLAGMVGQSDAIKQNQLHNPS
jgi:hypothetical protein